MSHTGPQPDFTILCREPNGSGLPPSCQGSALMNSTTEPHQSNAPTPPLMPEIFSGQTPGPQAPDPVCCWQTSTDSEAHMVQKTPPSHPCMSTKKQTEWGGSGLCGCRKSRVPASVKGQSCGHPTPAKQEVLHRPSRAGGQVGKQSGREISGLDSQPPPSQAGVWQLLSQTCAHLPAFTSSDPDS